MRDAYSRQKRVQKAQQGSAPRRSKKSGTNQRYALPAFGLYFIPVFFDATSHPFSAVSLLSFFPFFLLGNTHKKNHTQCKLNNFPA